MSEIIGEIFKNIFGDNVILATILISMIPIVELRGGIPFGMSKAFWGKNALSSWQAFGWSVLGSCLVVPVLALFFLPVINWLKKTKLFKKFAEKIENMIKSKSANIQGKLDKAEEESNVVDANKAEQTNVVNDNVNETNSESKENAVAVNKVEDKKLNKQFWIKFFGVLAFVAIPIPLTGVWTGTAIAVMIGLDFKWTCLSVITGNLIAGVIMQTICAIFPNFTTTILLIFLGITALLIIFSLIKNKINKNKNKVKIL